MTNQFFEIINTNFERGREGELLGVEDNNGDEMLKDLIVQEEELRMYSFGQSACVGNCKVFFCSPILSKK